MILASEDDIADRALSRCCPAGCRGARGRASLDSRAFLPFLPRDFLRSCERHQISVPVRTPCCRAIASASPHSASSLTRFAHHSAGCLPIRPLEHAGRARTRRPSPYGYTFTTTPGSTSTCQRASRVTPRRSIQRGTTGWTSWLPSSEVHGEASRIVMNESTKCRSGHEVHRTTSSDPPPLLRRAAFIRTLRRRAPSRLGPVPACCSGAGKRPGFDHYP